MISTLQTLSQELNLNLDGIVNQLDEKDDFIACCQDYVKKTDTIQALPFLTHLRKNGYPVVAKAICQFLIKTDPGALTRTLAA